jgi:uncharacterized protein (TIGR02646 family)
MRSVNFDPSDLSGEYLSWWRKWEKKARVATENVLKHKASHHDFAYQKAVWTELKQWLSQNVFHGKCAYCQSDMEVAGFGTADHHRPKGRVDEEPNHPGYYWLAYEWRNLLPCCEQCNSGGKGNKFPIEGRRVFSPNEVATVDDLDKVEKPLLLNPFDTGDGSPHKHVMFTDYGQIHSKNGSVRGEETIAICNLKRDTLATKRATNQEAAWLRWLALNDDPDRKAERDMFWKRIQENRIEHSAAVGLVVKQRWIQRLVEINSGFSDD